MGKTSSLNFLNFKTQKIPKVIRNSAHYWENKPGGKREKTHKNKQIEVVKKTPIKLHNSDGIRKEGSCHKSEESKKKLNAKFSPTSRRKLRINCRYWNQYNKLAKLLPAANRAPLPSRW